MATERSLIVGIDRYTPIVDAFNRLRVSAPFSLLDAKAINGMEPEHFLNKTESEGAVTHDHDSSTCQLTVTDNTSSYAARQTKRYFNYYAGKSQYVLMTFNFNGAVSGYEKNAGYFDDENGIFVRLDSDGLKLVIRSSVTGSPVDTEIDQVDWNIDQLDGTGPSKHAIDTSQCQILLIDFQWLGVGAVRIGFADGFGNILYGHQFEHANNVSQVYMSTPNLPIRWEVKNDGTGTAGAQVDAICCTCGTEGGREFSGTQHAVDRGISAQSIATTLTPIISIRNKTTVRYAHMDLIPTGIVVFASEVGTNYRWALMINPTVTGGTAASWTSFEDHSHVEYDIARDGAVTGGDIIASGYGAEEVPATIKIPDYQSINCDWDGSTPDEIVLCAQRVAGTAKNFYGGIQWLETL